MSAWPDPPPFRLLVVADFGVSRSSGPVPVTRETLDRVMADLAPTIRINVRDFLDLTEEGRDLDLAFERIGDFEPENVLRRLPALESTANLRAQLASMSRTEEVQSRLDDLLESVEKIGLKRALIGIGKADLEAVASGVESLDRVLGRQLDRILHHPRFQRLEAAWRGLSVLLPEKAPPERLGVEILHCRREEAATGIADALAGAGEQPISAVLLDLGFDHRDESVALLDAASRSASEHRSLLVAGVDPGIFGLDTLLHLTALPDLDEVLGDEEHEPFRELVGSDGARWTVLVANRFLLRDLHVRNGEGELGFEYREQADPVRRERYLWGRGIWLAGSCLVRAHLADGHCGRASGPGGTGAVCGLPSRPLTTESADRTAVEVSLAERDAAVFAHHGLSLLIGSEEPDTAYFPVLANLHRAESRRVSPEATAAHQILASRLSGYLVRLCAKAGDSPDAVAACAEGLEAHLRTLRREGEPEVIVEDRGGGVSGFRVKTGIRILDEETVVRLSLSS
jgi:type VI secretion system protein ImpC